MVKIWKRSLSMLLAVMMIFSMMPMQAIAAELEEIGTDDTSIVEPETPEEEPEVPEEEPEEPEEPEHTCEFSAVVTDPTCTEGGYTTYTCECGEVYTADEVEALGHSFEEGTCTACGAADPDYEKPEEKPTEEPTDAPEEPEHTCEFTSVVTDPTCTEGGYTTYTCTCGETYTADEVEALGHSFEEGTCTVCGEEDPDYQEELSGETRIIYFHNAEGWEEVYAAWSFDEEDFEDVEFPGEKMKDETELEDVWFVELPVEADDVLFSDGIEVTEELLAAEKEAGLEVIHEIAAELETKLSKDLYQNEEWTNYEDEVDALEAAKAAEEAAKKAAEEAAKQTEPPVMDKAPAPTADPVQELIDSLPAAVTNQDEYDAVYAVVDEIAENGYALTDAQEFAVVNAMAAADEWFGAEESATFANASLEVMNGTTTPIALINAVGWQQTTGRTYTIVRPDGTSFTTNGTGIGTDMKDSASITVVSGDYTIQYKSYSWSGSTTNTKTLTVTVKMSEEPLEVNDNPEMEINGYHTDTDYSARFKDVKQNILNAVLKNGFTNINDYTLYIWIDPVAGDARYFNYDDTSLLGDYNLLTVTNPYRFPCADFGDTKFSCNLKVKIIDKQGRTVESTIAVTEERKAATVTFADNVAATVTNSDQPIKDAAIAAATASNGGTLRVTAISGTMPIPTDPTATYTVTVEAAANGAALKGSDTVTVTVNLGRVNVTWQNEDGQVLDSGAVYYGDTPEYGGDTPTKADSATGQHRYEFKAWSPAVDAVTGDTIYTATYNEITKSYTISWDTNADGDVDVTSTADWGTDPLKGENVPTPVPSTNQSFDGWANNGNVADDGTITGAVTYTAKFTNDTVYEVKFMVDGTQLGDTQYVNVNKNGTVKFPADPDKANAIFAGWTNSDKIVDGVPTGNVTLEAQWNTNDANDNNVDDDDETITINVTADENSEWSVSGADKIGETNNYRFDSTGEKKLTITAAAKAQPNTYTKYELTTFTVNDESKTSPAEFTMTDGAVYNVTIATTTTTLTLNADQTIYVNKNLSVDPVNGLKEKVLSAVVDGYANNASNYTVLVDGIGDYDLDSDFSGILGGAAKVLLQKLLRGNEAKVKITDKTTGLYGTVTVALADSRPSISITTSDVTISAKEEPADVAQQVKNAVSIKAVDPLTGETPVEVSNSYISYNPAYAWPEDAQTGIFTVTVKVDSDATYIGATETLTLTCTDTTILYTVTYTDGVEDKEVFVNQEYIVPEFTAATAFDGTPIREFYTFEGWDAEISNSVESDLTYTATWKPVLDNNGNGIADEEEVYTVIYTDGVDDAEIFADAKTEGLAYGADTPDAPSVPTREGWNFKGWDVNPIPETVSAPTTGNTIIYTAQWTEAWVVTFVGHTYNATTEKEDGQLVDEPIDTWDDDHDFLGWFNGDVKYDFTAPVESNLNLIAMWQNDFNHNDIDDETEAHYTVTYTDGVEDVEVFADQTANVLVGLNTPVFNDGNDDATDGNEPVREDYIFNGWNPEVAETVSTDVTYVAQWLNDKNTNDVDDSLETITIAVTKAITEGEKVDNVVINGAIPVEGTDNYIFDSNNPTITITATPVVTDGISSTYVKSVTGAELVYGDNFVATANVTAKNGDVIEVSFAEAKFTYDEDGKMRFYVGMEDPNYETLYNAVILDPAYDATEGVVSAKYLARPAAKYQMQVPVLFQYTIPLIHYEIKIGGNTVDLDLDDAWLDVGESFKTLTPEELQKQYDTEIQKIKDKIAAIDLTDISLSNAWDKVKQFSAISDELTTLINTISNEAKYLGYHQFGASDLKDADGNVQEKLQVIYQTNALRLWNEELLVTLVDDRTPTTITAGNLTFEYDEFTDEDIMNAMVLTDVDGNVIEGNLTKHVDLVGTEVGERTFSVYYEGSWDYKPATAEFTLTVIKAPSSVEVLDQNITYPAKVSGPVITNKHGKEIDIDAIEFILGLDVADLDIDGDGVKGLEGRMQLILTEDLQTILSMVGLEEGVELNINDLISMLTNTGLLDQWGVSSEMVDTLNQILNAINGVVEANDLLITIGGEYPSDVGAYLHGAVTVDKNYETSYDVGYILIKPQTTEYKLEWNNSALTNAVVTLPMFNDMDKGAHAVGNEDFEVSYVILGVNDDKSEILSTDIYGNIKANIWLNADDIKSNGAYLQIAYGLNWGNEFDYAMPIVRAFAVVPALYDVQLVGATGTPNDELLKEFNNEPQGFSVIVRNDNDKIIFSDHYQNVTALKDNAQLIVNYTGVQTNGKSVNLTTILNKDNKNEPIAKPVHAGVYAATVFYAEFNSSDFEKLDVENLNVEDLYKLFDLADAGMDAGLLVIEPAESTVDVEEKIVNYNSETDILFKNMVKAGSAVEGLKPDTTIISAGIDTDAAFSESGWDAVRGIVNVDFPAWIDELLAEYAPGVKAGMSVAELKDVLLNKLPDISDKLIELGATEEMVNSLANLTGNVASVLAELPDNIRLSFIDDAKANEIGAYIVTAVVTDSDHYPSVDSGYLIVLPDVDMFELKWNYEDGNGIFTRDLLQHVDLLAKAYDAKSGAYDEDATGKISYMFVGIDSNGEFKHYTNAATLPNGAYIELAYIELDVEGEMIVSDMIARPIVVVASNCKVNVENVETVFDNTAHGVKVTVTDLEGREINTANGTVTVLYAGLQTNGKAYLDTKAPVHAGVYEALVTYTENVNGELRYYGTNVGYVMIDLAESEIAVTGKTVTYDGNGHTADVVATGSGVTEPDYTLISGGAYVSGNIDEIGVDAFHGNVNIDLPTWMDKALAEYEFVDGVNAAKVADYIEAYRDELVAAVKDTKLVDWNLVTEEQVNAAVEKLNAYIDELVAVLDKLPTDVALTFVDDITYAEPGAYFYYGIVTDSDHYPSTDTGLLVIEKKDMVYDLLNTTYTWDGEGKMVEINNPNNADALTLIIDRKNNTANFLIDNDAQYLLNTVARILGVDFDGDVQMSTILEKYSGEEVAAAIVKLITEAEKLELPEESAKALAAVKKQLQNLPADGTIVLNGDLPSEIGTYEVYAVSYSQYFKFAASEATLTILPAHFGDILVTNVTYNGTEQTGEVVITTGDGQIVDPSEYTVTGNKGTEAGAYEVIVTGTGVHYDHSVTLTWNIMPAEITSVEATDLVYNGTEQTSVLTVEAGNLVLTADDYTVTGNKGTNAGTYTVTVTGKGNFAGTASNTWAIAPATISSVVATDLVYNGTEQTSALTVEAGNLVLTADDYTVTGNKGTNAGTYTVTVTGKGNFTGVKDAKWNIIPAEVILTVKDNTVLAGTTKIPEVEFEVTNVNNGAVTIEQLAPSATWNVETKNGNLVHGEYANNEVTYSESDNWNVTKIVDGKLTVELRDYVCWNMQTGVYYSDLSDALDDVDGYNEHGDYIEDQLSVETIQMLKDYKEQYISLAPGTTLDLAGHTVRAAFVIGPKGSYITGDINSGKLYVSSAFLMEEGCYRDPVRNLDVLPIYIDGYYTFSYFRVNTTGYNRGLKVTEDEIYFRFVVDASGFAFDYLKNGATDNKLSFVIRLEWENASKTGTAYQDFVFLDGHVGNTFTNNNDLYLSLTGYEALDIDVDTLSVRGMVIADSGVTSNGTYFYP